MKKYTIIVASLMSAVFLNMNSVQADSYGKDLTVVQRPIADVSVPYSSHSNLKVTAWVDHRNNTYRRGENVGLYVQTNKDAYVTVIDVGTSGKTHQIFPNNYQRSHFIPANVATLIPGKHARFDFQVGGSRGQELIKVIATESSSSLISEDRLSKNGVIPKINISTKQLAKDLNVVLRQPQHNASDTYEKVIYIR